jgi:hypothetical protein
MSLTKDDLKQIKNVVEEVTLPRFDQLDKKIEDEIEGLARMSQHQFEVLHQDLTEVKEDVVVIKDMVKDHHFRITRFEHRRSGA